MVMEKKLGAEPVANLQHRGISRAGHILPLNTQPQCTRLAVGQSLEKRRGERWPADTLRRIDLGVAEGRRCRGASLDEGRRDGRGAAVHEAERGLSQSPVVTQSADRIHLHLERCEKRRRTAGENPVGRPGLHQVGVGDARPLTVDIEPVDRLKDVTDGVVMRR